MNLSCAFKSATEYSYNLKGKTVQGILSENLNMGLWGKYEQGMHGLRQIELFLHY